MTLKKTIWLQVINKKGEKRWKEVEVKLKDHVKVPIFPDGMSTKVYDGCLDDYLSSIAMEELPQNQPLWEVHVINLPTTNAAATFIFKVHHAIGDGISLMSALLSCFRRVDDPAIPLTFPNSVKLHTNMQGQKLAIIKNVTQIFSSVYNTVSDFCSGTIRNILIEDDKSLT